MNYVLHLVTMIGIYSILALSLNILVGYVGLLSLCHAAFYGIGAYGTTLLVMNFEWPWPAAVVAAVAFCTASSFIISVPSLRLRGDYFILAALGFQIIVFAVLYNWVPVTRGPYGIPGIPRPELPGQLRLTSPPAFALFTIAVAAAMAGLLYLLGRSPFGRTLKAIREDEIAAAALAKNVPWFKMRAFALAAGFAAVAGALFAWYMRYIDPTSFTVMESVYIVSILIIGGTGNLVGPLLGVVLMTLLPEALRFIHFPDALAANLRQIVYGVAIIAIMRFRPQGLLGEYRFD